MNVKIHSLSGITLKTIGVDKQFWLQGDDDENNLPYSLVMSKLSQITEMKTISKKLRCLVEASNLILRCVDEFYKPELRYHTNSLFFSFI